MIGDVLRGLEADFPASPCVPPETWIDGSRIRASCAKDVLERREDDRSRAERREQAAKAFAAARLSRPQRFTFGAQAKAKSVPKPKPKVERTAEVREYFRQYMRERRAKQKAGADLVRPS